MTRAEERTRRPKWPWVLLAIIVVAAVIATVVWVTNNIREGDPTPSPTVASPTQTKTTTATPIEDPAPTGCLGGPARDAAMVLAAQSAAPHTSNGAVEFATAFIRWAYQYPYPSESDADAVSAVGVSSEATTKDLAAFFASGPNVSGGLVPDNTDYYRSTIPGVWYLESYSGDEASVSLGTGVVVSGSLNPTVRGSVTVDVAWSDNGWTFVNSEGTRTTEELYSVGTAFTGGC